MKFQLKVLIALAVMTLVPAIGNAANPGPQGLVGVFLGPSFGSNGAGTSFDFGARGDYFFMPNLSGGLYLSYQSLSSITVGLVTASSSLTSVMAEANYYPLDDRNFYVGAKLGLGFLSNSASTTVVLVNVPNSSTSTTNLGFGPAVGYLYPVTSNISVGGEANYLIYTTSGGSTNMLNLLAQAVYNF